MNGAFLRSSKGFLAFDVIEFFVCVKSLIDYKP
jgi:hypothetical protein